MIQISSFLISKDDIEAVRQATKGQVPEDRLIEMARSRKSTEHAKELLSEQVALSKSNLIVVANKFLNTPIEESLESNDIVLDILALVDRRVGKADFGYGREDGVELKHPVVHFFMSCGGERYHYKNKEFNESVGFYSL